MIDLNAHYDGKVIVPDAPLDLPTNQRLRVSIEPIDSPLPAPSRVDLSGLLGLTLQPPNPHPRFPNDDALWQGSRSDNLTSDPRNNP